jgi:DNA-directed RNA polymerase specialized sigma24 family protein
MAAAGISIATLLRMSGAGAADGDLSLELYGRYAARLFRFCRRLTPDADAAEDAVQATVLGAARLLGAGFRPEFEAAWVFELAQRHATEGAPRPRRRAVAALPDELREPLELRLEGRSYTEIAEALGVARGTIELRVLQARSVTQSRRSRLGDLVSLGGALKAVLAGGAAVPATVAAVGAVAVVPRIVHHDSPPAIQVPAVVAPKVEPAAPTAAAIVRSPRRSVTAHPVAPAPAPAAAAAARRQAPERARPAVAAPVAETAPSPAPGRAAAPSPSPSPSPSPASASPAPAPVAQPAPAAVPVAAPDTVPTATPEPVVPALSTPVLEPVTAPPVVADPVPAVTAVVDQVVATVPTLPAAPPLPAPAPLPTLP